MFYVTLDHSPTLTFLNMRNAARVKASPVHGPIITQQDPTATTWTSTLGAEASKYQGHFVFDLDTQGLSLRLATGGGGAKKRSSAIRGIAPVLSDPRASDAT